MLKKWVGCAAGNFSMGRPLGHQPEAVVIHIMDGTLNGTIAWFNNPVAKVSAHYGVGKNGDIVQFVAEDDTAYHAGIVDSPSWGLIKQGTRPGTYVNPNYYTIGIEHEGRANDAWPDAMYDASAALIAEVVARWRIPLDLSHLVPHHAIRAGKTCPGAVVDLNRLMGQVRALTGAAAAARPATIPVRVLWHANLRQGQPSTTAPVTRVLTPGSALAAVGFTANGEAVNGNNRWYSFADGTYLWAGATDQP